MTGLRLFKALVIALTWIVMMSSHKGKAAVEASGKLDAVPALTDRQAYRSWLVEVYKARRYEDYLQLSAPFIAADPTATATARLLYRQMRSLRHLKQYEQARQKANEIIRDYPKSKTAKSMGGVDGLTEDQAAFAFAEISKAYHSKQFDSCITLCEAFRKNYPRNWRTHDLYVYYCYALYHSGHREKLIRVGREAISRKLVRNDGRIIRFLHAASLVKSGKSEQARHLLDQLETSSSRKLKLELAKLRFDSYFYENRYEELGTLARAYAEKHTTGTPEWAIGSMWSAVARAHQIPADLYGAAKVLDSIIAADVSDKNIGDHVPTHALYWRAWVAEKQGDRQKALSVLATIRNNAPKGPVRTRAIERLSTLINKQGD